MPVTIARVSVLLIRHLPNSVRLAKSLLKWILVRVAGEQGEPDIVGLRHGPAESASVDVTDVEVLEEPSLPPGHDRHRTLLSPSSSRTDRYQSSARLGRRAPSPATPCGSHYHTLLPPKRRSQRGMTSLL